MNEKLIPFDLAKCRAGEEVVTRDGRPYKFGAYNPQARDNECLLGWISGRVYCHFKEGGVHGYDLSTDLFMKPKKETLKIYVYRRIDGGKPFSLNIPTTSSNIELLETIEREYSL